MARVRPSKQEKLLVKPHRPVRRGVGLVALVFLLSASIVLGFWLGRQYEQEQQAISPGEREQLNNLQRQLAALERDKQVDLLALETSRKAIEGLEQEVSRLSKKVSFYRSVMEPENGGQGLQVHDLGVEQVGLARYRVNWVLAQVAKTTKEIEGRSDLRFFGVREGQQRVLSLSDVITTTMSTDFKFRYFQYFDVVVDIPKDFKVVKVEVMAESVGKFPQAISRKFDWMVQETLANVGE